MFNIQPADTWKQPTKVHRNSDDDKIVIDEESGPDLFMLNEDCILEIFKHLDFDSLVNSSEVCMLFNRLLHQHVFSRYREFEYAFESKIPLARLHRSLKCIGAHIHKLKFEWHHYDHNNRLQRFLEVLGKYVGKNIRYVRFRDTALTETNISPIQGILGRLDRLEIIVYNPDYDLDIDFVSICSNLRQLKLLENMQLIRCCKAWPTLEHFNIVGNEYMELNTFRSFLAQNQQLKCVKFTAYHADDRLRAVAQNLYNVQKLTILPSFPNLSASNIIYLSSLQHLTKLNLMYLDETDLNGILQCLTRFTGLHELKLHLLYDGGDDDEHYEPNQQAMITLSQELLNLEKFYTSYIRWNESTLIDFIKLSRQLRNLHIHWCDLPTTNSLIWKIVQVLQTNRTQPQAAPFEMFVSPNEVGLQAIDDKEILRHLRVSTKCNHSKSEQ